MEFQIKTENEKQLPGVIQVDPKMENDRLFDQLRFQRAWVTKQLNQYGAILFKGTRFSVDEFGKFMDVLFPDLSPFNPHIFGIFSAGRKVMGKNVVESTYLAKNVPMALHNEFNYLPIFPRYICFRCVKVPLEGGETVIADYRKVYNQLKPDIRQKFETKQVRYTRNYFDQRLVSSLINKYVKIDESWKEVFKTESREEVEKVCRKHDIEFKWGKRDYLQISSVLPAVRTHPETREKVWFNQAAQWLNHPKTSGWQKFLFFNTVYPTKNSKPINVSFGDGSSISPNDALEIIDVINQNSVAVKWDEGDILLCDNYLVAHGRRPYKGERVLATAMR